MCVSVCLGLCVSVFPCFSGMEGRDSVIIAFPRVREKKSEPACQSRKALGNHPVESLIVHTDAETEGQRGAGNSKEGLRQS